MKITRKSFTLSLAVLLFSLTAIAQQNGVVRSPDGRTVYAVSPAKQQFWNADNTHYPASVIYNNLATKNPKGLYFSLGGETIEGPGAGSVQWMAAPFTPISNGTVGGIIVPLGYVFAFTSTDVILSLNADDNGLPGAALQTWTVTINKNIVLGSCCAVYTENGSVNITGGQQYWVVVSTEPDSDMYAAWNLNVTDEVDQVTNAYYDGTGWYTFQTINGVAFAVLPK